MIKSVQPLKIALDYHGVINGNVEYFKTFCKIAIARKHRIYILTGGPKEKVIRQLDKAEVPYFNLFTITDYYQDQKKAFCGANGEFLVDEKLWNTAKADYCKVHKIDVLIDDSKIYEKYFATPYCLYSEKEKNCNLSTTGDIISFEENPAKAIEKLERILS